MTETSWAVCHEDRLINDRERMDERIGKIGTSIAVYRTDRPFSFVSRSIVSLGLDNSMELKFSFDGKQLSVVVIPFESDDVQRIESSELVNQKLDTLIHHQLFSSLVIFKFVIDSQMILNSLYLILS